ncbi:3021_t:CDS:2, partial [Racocetra persica]
MSDFTTLNDTIAKAFPNRTDLLATTLLDSVEVIDRREVKSGAVTHETELL